MKYDALIFDLDGVLWDTCEACAIAWNIVVKRNQIKFKFVTAEDVRRVSGKSHENCIRETFQGLSEKEIQIIIQETIIEDNIAVEEYGGKLYPEVLSGLKQLRERYPLFIVSNCQSGYIETFLRLNNIAELLKDFECWGNTRKTKSENLKSVIQRNNLKSPIYIGDTEGDRIAARDNAIPFLYMTYGFGKVTDYDKAFSSFLEFKEFILTS
jgi:phosphoglycolate phosphatase